ncbi:MAG TPA: metal-dependent transcriptional regulator [Bacilli bacterium]|nr:MAG: Transcriptional regulator MntR [Tenericutes bacterium ADurb.BinA124]HNZ50490.1 metal-dependent transcriptional regulator [Bacilli bacterium]HPX84736.1 metal-dependent transcriptional regulator [Bacilli bacterium]HQC74458.1 metal-dependent transcriptional regulator [Bacilli bacterium]
MTLFESGENYLETIYKLSLNKNGVHAIDVAKELNYSKPSISVALKKLSRQGYLLIDSDSHIILTEKGINVAKKIYERHKILTSLLIKLGVDEKTAENDACIIEHHLSNKSFEAFKKLNDSL